MRSAVAYSKILTRLGSITFKTVKTPPTNGFGFGTAARVYGRKLGLEEANPPLFPKLVANISNKAILASSGAVVLSSFVLAYHLNESVRDEVDTRIGTFMASYGNQIFLERMANEAFRESVYALRDAELLHYGISFEDNEKHAVFYRGMTLPTNLDQDDPRQVKQWQDDIVGSLSGRGFSPLLWLTRPSATRAEGFNIHPHDGNVARASAPDAPPSWSADVMAMTCDFDTLKGYSSLGSKSKLDGPGCFMLVAPQKITYLSSTDVKARSEKNIGHEFEVITPHIDSSDTLAILFVENGKISRVVINQDVVNETISRDAYTIDIQLVKNLKDALSNAAPEAQSELTDLITQLERQTHTIDLIEEFESKFNLTVDELIENTKEMITACDKKIDEMPGVVGIALRAIKRDNKVLSREEVAKRLDVPLTPKGPTDENSIGPNNDSLRVS